MGVFGEEGAWGNFSSKIFFLCALTHCFFLFCFLQIFDDADAVSVQEALTTHVLNIFVVSKARDGDKQAGIAIEGAEVRFGIPDVAHACTYLMGLIYTLELRYPNKLKYTFEVFQKIFLELEDVNHKVSSKVHKLKVCLHA